MSAATLIISIEWAIRAAMIPIVARRHDPHPALAWVALIFLQPFIGLFFYLLVGSSGLPRRRIRARMGQRQPFCPVECFEATAAFELEHDSDSAGARVRGLSRTISESPVLSGNALEFETDDRGGIDALIADLDAARAHVHMLFYIWADDETGRRVGDALIRAAGRGVTCRVLVDAAGSPWMLRRLAPKLREAGVEVVAALPVRLWRIFLRRIDLRNHRKLAVIDGHIAYTGSRNIVNADYGRRELRWIDVMVRLRGPIVTHLQSIFIEDWYFETQAQIGAEVYAFPIEAAGDVAIQAVPSGPIYPTEAFVHLIVAAIHGARERVVITTPYFIPDEPTRLALEMAARRGVHVELVVPRRADHLIVSAATRAHVTAMLTRGVTVYQHLEGLLHTKSLTVDDTFAVIGSGNIDVRSFYLNFELNLLLIGPDITRRVRELQQQYVRESRELDLATWRRRPRSQQMLDDAAKLFSPLL